MITGFNTDVPHEGRVYHVQTEDRRTGDPVFESLVYVGGSIVAKKLTPYSDKLNDGATEETLASLLKRQHQVIIAAIKAGRIEDLIQHTLKTGGESQKNQATGKINQAADNQSTELAKQKATPVATKTAAPLQQVS